MPSSLWEPSRSPASPPEPWSPPIRHPRRQHPPRQLWRQPYPPPRRALPTLPPSPSASCRAWSASVWSSGSNRVARTCPDEDGPGWFFHQLPGFGRNFRMPQQGPREGLGSGFVIDSEGGADPDELSRGRRRQPDRGDGRYTRRRASDSVRQGRGQGARLRRGSGQDGARARRPGAAARRLGQAARGRVGDGHRQPVRAVAVDERRHHLRASTART